MGFELADATIEDLQANFLDNPAHDITLSIDGAPAFSVKSSYQSPFVAVSGSGPRWKWDHDGDGRGDRDGDGIGDWDGPVMFFRYQHPGLTAGTHTFTFNYIVPAGNFIDTITVEAVP